MNRPLILAVAAGACILTASSLTYLVLLKREKRAQQMRKEQHQRDQFQAMRAIAVLDPQEALALAVKSGDGLPKAWKTKAASKIAVHDVDRAACENRVRGLILGAAVGDAVGLLTEFMSKEMTTYLYPPSKPLQFKDCAQDSHRAKWVAGDWTDDTDQLLLLLETLVATGGVFDVNQFAERLSYWDKHGFPELGDPAGMGMGRTVGTTVRSSEFLSDPIARADKTWERSNRHLAANGGLMRCACMAAPFQSIDTVIRLATASCRVTHSDPRCIASCVSACVALAMLLDGNHSVSSIVDEALRRGEHSIRSDGRVSDDWKAFAIEGLRVAVDTTSLASLHLDDSQGMGYTYKALGCAFWAIKQTDMSYREIIEAIVREGGDADTNAVIAGAMAGASRGADGIDAEWVEGLVWKNVLDDHIDALIGLLWP